MDPTKKILGKKEGTTSKDILSKCLGKTKNMKEYKKEFSKELKTEY
ncbi:MAG: hypothetical protein ACOCVF_02835 [bacterium]